MRVLVDHYRDLTWTYERAAHLKRTPSSLRDRRTNDVQVPPAVDRHLDAPRLPRAAARSSRSSTRGCSCRCRTRPALHARLYARVSYSRRLALSLRRIYPGHVTTRFAQRPGADRAGDPAPLAAPERFRRARRLPARAGDPGLAARLVPLHPPLRGRLELEHGQRLLRRPAARPAPSRACTGRSSSTASARRTTGRSGPSSRPRSGPTSRAGDSRPGRTRPASAACSDPRLRLKGGAAERR